VATLMPYDGTVASVAPLVKAGAGGLVSEVYSDDTAFVKEAVLAWASHHGRMVLGSSKIAAVSLPPGAVMPTLVHGGPGRAGGGEELGGIRGLAFYQQRTALEGSRAVIEKLFGSANPAAAE
jgi:oxepin-CoA hydrolase/3-oxo-5,6-dehydrosuberyl-CoA semialdehyde dehydrogenase